MVSQVTEVFEGSRFPQTTTKYRCSNESCQSEKDKQKEKRLKMQEERELASLKRKGKNTADKSASIASAAKKN